MYKAAIHAHKAVKSKIRIRCISFSVAYCFKVRFILAVLNKNFSLKIEKSDFNLIITDSRYVSIHRQYKKYNKII